MRKRYRAYEPGQDLLLPPSLREWLPENYLAYFVSDLVDLLDLSSLHAVYEKDLRGQPPYDPRMMTKLLVYAYCVGVFSARRIQQRLQEDVAFRMLAAGNEPDFRTLSDFRKIHLQTLEGFFEQVLKLARELGMLKMGRVALDGTKMGANASKHKAMSYGRMKEQEPAIRAQVKELLARAEATDAEEDGRYGKERRGDELPEELRRRETRLQRIREAKRALEERAGEEAKAEGKAPEEAQAAAKAQSNFTDPESRIMKSSDGFVQGYHAQAAVEPFWQLIVGQGVTQAGNDKEQVEPMASELNVQFAYSERFARSTKEEFFPAGYRIPDALRGSVRQKRVAIVNDVINAGSAVRGTFEDLENCGAIVVAIGALLVLGNAAKDFAEGKGVALENLAALPNNLWGATACSLCASGVPLQM